MPELPEVETITRSLRNSIHLPFLDVSILAARPGVIGRVISNCIINWPRSIAFPEPVILKAQVVGQRVSSVQRRGKYVVIGLSNSWLLIHLRMSGDLRVENQEGVNSKKHDRVILEFQDSVRLIFNDARKFGRLWLVGDPALILGSLGPEPLSDELNGRIFWCMLQGKARQIKPLLLDQTFMAGLGNIYTDEALHQARIHPLEVSNHLSENQASRLLDAIREVLQEGIHRNGASIDWVYRGGDFQNSFKVYQQTGEACPDCGTLIERILVGQRGTHYCPSCQPISCIGK